MSKHTITQLPYGLADFREIQQSGMYYVDKTRFIPLLEASSRFLFFIRPRRFGKTLWLSVLENYYDIGFKDRFEETFRETYIGEHPTEERNSYLVLMFNLAMVNPDRRVVNESFEDQGRAVIEDFLIRYEQFFQEEERNYILSLPKTENQLRRIFFHAARENLKIYLLIDEYDNFANTILTTAGKQAYHELTHGAGFFRYFFNLLKGATSGRASGLSRLFITGVSPITMDDVTSGFNIGDNISLDPQFNELPGFSEAEVRDLLTYYRQTGQLTLDVAACLELMQRWYDHYRFSTKTVPSVYNSDMVLYFVKETLKTGDVPERMIDQNVRVDYGKLRHLVLVDRTFNGNFGLLRAIIERGETVSDVNLSFPLERLLDRMNFVSLLFYFGLLSVAGTTEGMPRLRIPNRTIREMMFGYLRDALYDVDVFRLDLFHFSTLMRAMAYRGEWQPVFDVLAEQVRQQTAVRDYLDGEKMIQGFLLAYLNVTGYFLTWSERELGKGFADLYLEPFLARFPDMRYGYLIELKYLPRGEFSDAKLDAHLKKAIAQTTQYADDAHIRETARHVTVKKLVLVYHGWELVHRGEIGVVDAIR
jgi:hypothetical protein